MIFNRLLIFIILIHIYVAIPLNASVQFEQIKNRQIAQFELTDIMIDLARQNNIDLLEQWKKLSPKSFENLDFTKAYLLAADRSLDQHKTNQALSFYIKSYQAIEKTHPSKVEAAYKASFFLYAQKKRAEALFYINRSIEELIKVNLKHPLASDIFYFKRRIVWRYFSRLEALPDNAISTVEFDGDDIWIGMWSGGLGRFSRSSSQLDLFNPRNTDLPSFYVRDILVHSDKIWVATHSGLAYYQKSDSSWHVVDRLKNLKLKTIIYNDNFFYVATLFEGVFRSEDGIIWTNIIPSQNVLDLLYVDGELYIATPEKGVFVYKDSKLESFLPDISAKTIIQDENPDFLWIGTYGQGLLKINRKNGKIINKYSFKDINSDYVESLLLLNDKLWVGTLDAGVSIFDIKKNNWNFLGLRDGLPGLDITTITRENDHLWFGTLAGGIGIYLFEEQFPVEE